LFESLSDFGIMVGINAPTYVVEVAADIGTHLLHLSLCNADSVLAEETFKASERARCWCELTNRHCTNVSTLLINAVADFQTSPTCTANQDTERVRRGLGRVSYRLFHRHQGCV